MIVASVGRSLAQTSKALTVRALATKTPMPLAEQRKREKLEAKKERAAKYEQRQQRKSRQATRRIAYGEENKNGFVRGGRKKEFEQFMIRQSMKIKAYERAAKEKQLDWKVRVAAVVERLPVISGDIPDWERDWYELESYLGNITRPDYPKGNPFYPTTDNQGNDNDNHPTLQELIDQLPFKPAPRETEADATGDIRTLDRALKERVYLVIKNKDGSSDSYLGDSVWQYPSVIVEEGESMLTAALRSITQSVGSDLEVYGIGNAPMACDVREYTEEMQKHTNCFGEKIFFYRIQRDEGDVCSETKTVQDSAWLTRSEMVQTTLDHRGHHQSQLQHYLL